MTIIFKVYYKMDIKEKVNEYSIWRIQLLRLYSVSYFGRHFMINNMLNAMKMFTLLMDFPEAWLGITLILKL